MISKKKAGLVISVMSKTMNNRCSCPYCCGGCEIIDGRSIEFYPCEECMRAHIEEDENGELIAKEDKK